MFLTRVMPGHDVEMEPLPSGINVISNDCWGSWYQRKVNHAHVLAVGVEPDEDEHIAFGKLFRALGNHDNADRDPFQALCVHADRFAFGTRSTSVVTVSNQGVTEYWYSEGPPCQSTGMKLCGRMLRLDFEVLEPVELADDEIEVIG
jgi:hypothetical protein